MKINTFFIHNLWWLIPLSVIVLFWQHASPIILLLVFAYLGRVVLNPVVCQIDTWLDNRKLSVFITMFILIIILFFLSVSLFPFIKNQTAALQSILSLETFSKFQLKFSLILKNILPAYLFNILSDFTAKFDTSVSEIWVNSILQINSFIDGAGTVFFTLGSVLLSIFIIIMFMIFFLLEGEKFSKSFLFAIPPQNYGIAKRMLSKTSKQINSYIRGQFLAGISVSITTIIGLSILKWITNISIPYTLLIGIIAGLFNLIPFIGPVIGMIPAIIIYLITDQIMPIHILYIICIIGVFAIVQLIDNLIMSPYIMGSSVGIHPMLIIILVLFGASLGGVLGILFAVPIAAILKVIIEELVDHF